MIASVHRVLVILAKAPVPGRVKTRLCPPATPAQAADVAAAALLDTLDAALAVPGCRVVVALDGDPRRGARAAAVRAALAGTTVVAQRGTSLGERITAAHDDVAGLAPGAATVQIGMDTPQVTPALLEAAFGAGPALGPAADGGWWALALPDPRRAALVRDVPTSRPDTGTATLAALRAGGLTVALLPELTDVDTARDARAVAAACPDGRFAAAVAALRAAA
jgi:uncharacterized protein